MNNFYIVFLFAIASYLVGNINFALIISKMKKSDVRKCGSGNPGTLNMSRNFGLKIGLLTFFLDVLKGAVPTLVAFLVFKNQIFKGTSFLISDFAMCLCGLAVVLGHIYPVFLKFKGGKGIASTIGVFLVANIVMLSKSFGAFSNGGWLVVSLMSLIAAIVFIYFTEFGAMGSFIAITPQAIAVVLRMSLMYGDTQTDFYLYILTNIIVLLICFFTWFAHRKNIERMLAGEEHPTSIKEMIVKAKMKKLMAKAEKEGTTLSLLENNDNLSVQDNKIDNKEENKD